MNCKTNLIFGISSRNVKDPLRIIKLLKLDEAEHMTRVKIGNCDLNAYIGVYYSCKISSFLSILFFETRKKESSFSRENPH